MDPIFAISIGLVAAVVRIRRDEHDAGRDPGVVPVARRGWGMVTRRLRAEGLIGIADSG